MTIGERLKHNDIDTYNRLTNMFKAKIDKPKKQIKLGDSIENLMRADSYCRSGRRIKQRGWG